MKTLILSTALFLTAAIAANANSSVKFQVNTITVTTSCGTSYKVTCDGCTTTDFVNIALALDAVDCS